MTRDILDINDFTILVEAANTDSTTFDSCIFDEAVIAVAFYGSGNVELSVKYEDNEKEFRHTKGLALSFYADEKVEFQHKVSASKPLECIVIATSPKNLAKLSDQESELFADMLKELVEPSDHYVEGPQLLMPPEMQSIVDQLFHGKYVGKAKLMFFRTQISSLLAHFFGQLSIPSQEGILEKEKEQLLIAKNILSDNLEDPPSLSELSKQIGMNTFKLKKGFKQLFGVPVFKYLQNERLSKAHDLLSNENMSIQEAAWHVGYDSLSSFSNAFVNKFGYRPSGIKG